MSKKQSHSSGSLSLSMCASMLSGLFLTILFADLVRYTIASQAVEQAARKAARCLTPTDAECVQTSVVSGPGERDWFSSERGNRATDWVDRYHYDAAVYLQSWEAGFQGFRIHLIEKPPITWSALSIPVKTFQSGLNRYEYREKTIAAQVLMEVGEQHYRVSPVFPANTGYFPDFDLSFEELSDRAPMSSWSPRTLIDRSNPARGYRNFPEANFNTIAAGTQAIAAGNVGRFSTGFVEVPLLPSDSPAVTCEDAAGRPCDVRRYAGSATMADYSWERYAAVAIKPFANVRRLSGSPSIGWSGSQGRPGSPNPGWGLELEVISRAANDRYKAELAARQAGGLPPPAPPSGNIRCLGGRSATSEITSDREQPFHLWLRGPSGAHGGGTPNCPAAQNSRYSAHDSMLVERGGAYRISGYLSVEGTGAVEASVLFKHFFDTYEPYTKTLPREKSCLGTVKAFAGESDMACQSASVCGEGKILETRSCNILEVKRRPLCLDTAAAALDPHAFVVPAINCGESVTGAVCDDSERPNLPSDCTAELMANPGRVFCGWMEDTSLQTRVELAEPASSCPLGVLVQKKTDCGNKNREIIHKVDSAYGNANECPAVARIRRDYLILRDSLNSRQASGLPRFGSPVSLSVEWSKDSPRERWAPAFELPPEVLPYASDPDVVERGEVLSKNFLPVYRRENPAAKPSLSAFGFFGTLREDVPISLNLLSETRKEIVSSYPFANKPEFEIPESFPGDSCGASRSDLNTLLRAYAARELPELVDSDIVFEPSARYADSIPVRKTSSCPGVQAETVSVPPCTKVSYRQVEQDVCPTKTYLGRFDNTEHPLGPPICSEVKKRECSSEPVGVLIQAARPEEQIDYEAAQASGFSEIKRTFGNAALGCQGANCATIAISQVESDSFQVEVSYSLPLTFPLGSILGSEAITLSSKKSELRERSSAGRYAGAAYGDPEI